MNKRIILYIVAIVILLLFLIAAVIVIFLSFGGGNFPIVQTTTNVEETPETIEPTATVDTPANTSTPIRSPSPIQTATTGPLESDTPEPENTIVASGVCDRTGSEYLLWVFEDSSRGNPPFGAELIRLLKVDYDTAQVSSYAFPRYLDLSTPDLYITYGISQYQLGSIFHAVYQRVANQPDAIQIATNGIGQAIYDNFEVVSDHFFTFDKDSVQRLMQFIGPINIENPAAFSTGENEFPKGLLEINEQNAWDYLSYSNTPEDEYFRLSRQDLFLNALFAKLNQEVNQSEFAAWWESEPDWIVSDLDAQQGSATFCAFFADSHRSDFAILPEDLVSISQTGIAITDMNAASTDIQNFLSANN